MESQNNTIAWMNMLDRPAFCVLDGVITDANQAAADRFVPVGEPVAALLVTGQEEYAAFTAGLLSLTLRIGSTTYPAAVCPIGQYHVFTLDSGDIRAELRAMDLAAQKLRIPLGSVLAMTSRLFPSLDLPKDSPAAEQVARINKNLYQMLRVLNNMTDTAYYARETPVLVCQDVNAVLSDIFEHAAMLCEYSDCRLEFTGLNAPVCSEIDEVLLERAVYCVLSNALNAAPKGSTIDARLTQNGSTLHLIFSNPGPAIDWTDLNAFRERFTREPSLENGSQGVGLGIKLIEICAAAHGGVLLFEPLKGGGLKLNMSLRIRSTPQVRDKTLHPDRSGLMDCGMIELSETLPYRLYGVHTEN